LRSLPSFCSGAPIPCSLAWFANPLPASSVSGPCNSHKIDGRVEGKKCIAGGLSTQRVVRCGAECGECGAGVDSFAMVPYTLAGRTVFWPASLLRRRTHITEEQRETYHHVRIQHSCSEHNAARTSRCTLTSSRSSRRSRSRTRSAPRPQSTRSSGCICRSRKGGRARSGGGGSHG
jgi:hypothetical protein